MSRQPAHGNKNVNRGRNFNGGAGGPIRGRIRFVVPGKTRRAVRDLPGGSDAAFGRVRGGKTPRGRRLRRGSSTPGLLRATRVPLPRPPDAAGDRGAGDRGL